VKKQRGHERKRSLRGKRVKPETQKAPRLPMALQAAVERIVPFEWTIAAYDSQLPAVFSTPAMIGLMEVAAAQAIQNHLPEGSISVGTRIEVDHLKAVPLGTKVRAHARLAGSKGRFLVFEAEAKAGELVIGRGRVYRAVVSLDKFRSLLEK
jgi:fluoroacetyl-CoA thioesterase